MADNTTLGSMTGGDVIATDDIGGVKYQRVKATYGSDGAATDVDQGHGLPVSGQYTELTGTWSGPGSSVALVSTDVRGYTYAHVALNGGSNSNVFRAEFSNDNTNWYAEPGVSTSAVSAQTSLSPGSIWTVPVVGRYMRIFNQSYISGTTAITVELLDGTVWAFGQGGVPVNVNTIQSVATNNVIGDGLNSMALSPYPLGSAAFTWNGSSWDRQRSANAAQGTTGTGVPDAAGMYFDGTNYQRVTPGAGLPISGQYTELTGTWSGPGQGTVINSVDVRPYASVNVQAPSGSSGNQFSVQFSNDNATWHTPIHYSAATNSSQTLFAATHTDVWTVPVTGRYMRVQCVNYNSGTTTIFAELAGAPAVPVTAQGVPTYNSGSVSVADGNTNHTQSSLMPSSMWGYGGNFNVGWQRLRTPIIYKTATASAAGDNAVWTPTAGTKFRLMRYLIEVTGDAATAGGAELDMVFRDATTAINIGHSVYVPATSGTTLGGYQSGWIDLGNGVVSAVANNVLNLNLSAALTAGKVRVTCCGTEG